ncbi:GNAT family N-acetyltransferase [Bacillus kexueae]|uniref:GNAT family N-acetyltransferase n=1 Tax=Aeribacillus kexueae TaxID=2078952 RepID=UPI001FAE7A09|nr:hypothetical protein [Bacillus kexueae]
MFYSLRLATKSDIDNVKEFVGQAGLSTNGIEASIQQFMLLERDSSIVGCIGIEKINGDGLLRSFVASKEIQKAHLMTLLESVDVVAEKEALQNVYLVTNEGASLDFLTITGFQAMHVDKVPEHIRQNEHVKQAIHKTSTIIMVK